MFAAKDETLSPDELRKRLYQTFKDKGVLDTLKTQLRNQLIRELKPPLPAGDPVRSDSLLASAWNYIVADYLRRSGYEYTLSVFGPESGLCKDKVFTREDLLQLLKISPQSALYTSLSGNQEHGDEGFLINLLTQLTHQYTHTLCQDADTQTSNSGTHGESLVEKMQMIDKEYEGIAHSGDKYFSFESRLAAYRKEMEMQMQIDLNIKMQHFKAVEIAKVKMEEKAQFQKDFDKLKQELEKNYETKATSLNNREKNAIERLQKQQEIEEKNIYMERQAVLKEIDTVRCRENELRLRMDAFEKTCQIHEEKVRTAEELLRRRELSVKTMEDGHEQRLKNELSRYQLELKEEYMTRTEKLSERENRNQVETTRIQKEFAVLDAKLEEHSRTSSELRRLQAELDTAQQQTSLLSQQKKLLQERLDTMSDYPSLKREKAQLQGQVRLLKTQLEEAQEENRLLHADSAKPSKEQLALQMELRRLQSAHKLDGEEFDNQKQVLQAQLQSEVERCAQLRAQLLACEEKLKWTTGHVQDLTTQLRHTQQALENEVLRNPKPSLVDRSVLDFSADKLVPPDIYVDRAVLRASAGYDNVSEAAGAFRRPKSPVIDPPDSNTEVVAAAKARILELQMEADALEDAYRNYQQRAARSTISNMLPPRPLSPQSASHRPDSSTWKPGSYRSRPFSHSHSHQTNGSHKQPPPQSTSPPRDTRKAVSSAQPRNTFSKGLNRSKSRGPFPEQRPHPLPESLIPSDGGPSVRLHSRETGDSIEGPAVPLPFPDRPPTRRLPAAPPDELSTSGDLSPELSPPRSPQLQSTVRDPPSAPKQQQQQQQQQQQLLLSSSESSPQPEKINLEDLSESFLEPGCIPELLLDTAVPLCEEAPGGPSAPRPQTPQELPEDSHDQASDPQTSAAEEEEEDDEQRWERERRERGELRQRQREEARAREQQELERLEREAEEANQEEAAAGGEEEEEEEEREEPQVPENPLEKYMKMALQAREKQPAQRTGLEEEERVSLEDKTSEEKGDSIAVYSHKDEEEDDFW